METKNYNYFYDEDGTKIVINGLKDYRELPQMSAVLILKNNQYIREMKRQKLSCISSDVISPDYNASGAMYILFSYILHRFDFYLSAENCLENEVSKYLQICEDLIPELLYEAKYYNYSPQGKPPRLCSYLENYNELPERIRFLFFLSLNHVIGLHRGLSSCFYYVEKYFQLAKHEGRACKNEFGGSANILHKLFDTFSFPQQNS